MKLYHRKYFEDTKKAESQDTEKPARVGIEYLVNQAIIWIAILFLAVATAKKFF